MASSDTWEEQKRQEREQADQDRKDAKQLAEFVNRMSEVLFGYREAAESEILERVRALVDQDKSLGMAKKRRVKKFRTAFEKLIQQIDEFGNP